VAAEKVILRPAGKDGGLVQNAEVQQAPYCSIACDSGWKTGPEGVYLPSQSTARNMGVVGDPR